MEKKDITAASRKQIASKDTLNKRHQNHVWESHFSVNIKSGHKEVKLSILQWQKLNSQ